MGQERDIALTELQLVIKNTFEDIVMSNKHHLELTQVGMDFPTTKGSFNALQDVNLRINKGEFISLIGHSGC